MIFMNRKKTGRGSDRKERLAEQRTKGDATREKILDAARGVFSRHPYNAASVRMIGKEGRFDHAIIRYHFPNKAALFEAVIADIFDELQAANLEWFQGLEKVSPRKGLSMYIDNFVEYNSINPEALKIIMQNIAQADILHTIPGYRRIPEFLAGIRRVFEEKIPSTASSREIGMFLDSFMSLSTYYLGASLCQAQILCMNPDGEQYRQWLKETLLYVFAPLLEKIVFHVAAASEG